MMLFPYSIFLKKKNWGENAGNFFFSWHVRYCLYFCLISQFFML